MRAASMGVSVNETISETAIANEEVKPNDDMKRPTMPAMNPTGRNTANKDRGVAGKAKPNSRGPWIGSRNHGHRFFCLDRETFGRNHSATLFCYFFFNVSSD